MIKFSRETSIILNFLINEILPPALRDSKFFMKPLFKLAFGANADIFLNFRELAPMMNDQEYADTYRKTANSNLLKGSDLNKLCKERICNSAIGPKVLDVGCGRGELLSVLPEKFVKFGCDIFEHQKNQNVFTYKMAFAERLPYRDQEFDTVICTHVLEHVRNLEKTIDELRRVCKKRLIIVVPKERSYKFGFNLHLSFFPYRHSIESSLKTHNYRKLSTLLNLGGDWYYQEEQPVTPLNG